MIGCKRKKKRLTSAWWPAVAQVCDDQSTIGGVVRRRSMVCACMIDSARNQSGHWPCRGMVRIHAKRAAANNHEGIGHRLDEFDTEWAFYGGFTVRVSWLTHGFLAKCPANCILSATESFLWAKRVSVAHCS